MFTSRYLPCPDCGASMDRTDPTPHVCEAERVVDFRMFALRPEIDRFDGLLSRYLGSPAGRFEAWLAARDVRRAAS
jgi:hypothetical protein